MTCHRNPQFSDQLLDKKSGLYIERCAPLAEVNFLSDLSVLNSNRVASGKAIKVLNETFFVPIDSENLQREKLYQRTSLFRIRSFSYRDRASVFELLSILPTLYPRGAYWLDRRLDDALCGRARCTLAVNNRGQSIGVTIETPKEPYRLKLSTIYVHPTFRGLGIGRALLDNCYSAWLREELKQVYVTAALHVSETLFPTISQFGFSLKTVVPGRYGIDRDEVVFDWSPERL